MSNAVGGEHFFQSLSNSRLDWRVNYARATRDEPDLRETLYERLDLGRHERAVSPFTYADESQSGFRMFNDLNDDTMDVGANWSVFNTAGGRPTQYKFGVNYVERDARLPVAPVPLHSDHDAEGRRRQPAASTTAAAARGDVHSEQHRHGVPVQRGDAADRRLRRRSDDDIRLRHGRHRAWPRARG